MKSKNNSIIFIIVILAVVMVATLSVIVYLRMCNTESLPNEGSTEVISQESWIDTIDDTSHTTTMYSLGNTATKVSKELPNDVTLNHMYIDDIPIYEMYPTNAKDCKLVILLHGQCSRKEEFLEDMINYVDAGYLCVCIDLVGHGERISSEPIMSLEITSQTGKDLNTLISYYSNKDYADIDNFGIVGLSQGGSVAYWYTAYGYYTPSVIVVGSTTPDYTYFMDDTCIQNGKRTESIWDSTQIADFINKNNPINQLDKLSSIPTMSGNSLDDTIVSYKGSEAFEKVLKDNNNTDSIFYYFDGVGHNVTEDFVQKIIPYIKKWL